MKIIIAGAGEVGTHLAKMLSTDYHELTIIDNDEARLAAVSEVTDAVTIEGSPTSIEILRQAGVDKADLFIAVVPAKEQDANLVSSMLAKQMGAKTVTARINNEEYLNHENKLFFTDLGIDLLFYPERNAANEIINLLKESRTSEIMDFAHGKLQLVVFKLSEGAPLIDKCPKDFNYPAGDLSFRAIAISRDGTTIIPHGETRFHQNDMVYVIAKKEGIDECMKYSGKGEISIKRLLILGGGRIGEMVAQKMENICDYVKIIEMKPERCKYLSEKLTKTTVVNGDGRNSELLQEEDAEGFDAYVAVSSNSEINILSCVETKHIGVTKTIAEVEDIEYIKLAESMGVDAVINKKLITASRIYRFTLNNKVRSVKYLTGTDAEMLEFVVNPNSPITKDKLKNLDFPDDAIIGGVIRGNESFIAVGETEFKPYDRVAVFALPEALKKLDRYFI